LRVLLIDGDLRRPALHTALNVRNDFGLRDMLRSDAPFRDRPATEFCKPTEFPNLWVLPSGTGNEEAVELLHSSRVRDLVLHLAKDFDVVLIDTPPMLHMADARIFASKVDGVILVLRSGVTMREEAMSAVELFERDRVHVVGTILNGFNPSKEGRGNYYKSYFRYKDDLAPKEEVSSR
jgi:succinoglycan biosynthesis transport protein ExoP